MFQRGLRAFVFMFFIVALGFCMVENANSASVLTNPPDGTVYTDTRNVTFTCVSYLDSNVNVTLYTNISGSWTAMETQMVATGATAVFVLNNVASGWYLWNCLGANDSTSEYASANRAFRININSAPSFSGTIPNLNWSEDTPYASAINLSQYFSDGDALNYAVSGNSKVAISVTNGMVTLTPPSNWFGTENVIFTASDGWLSNTSNTVILTVAPVNDPVTFSGTIPIQNWYSGQSLIVNLRSYFTDPENDTLTFYHSSIDNITVSMSSGNATLYAPSKFSGTRYITFYANDTNSSASSNSVNLIISNNGLAPVITSHLPAQDITIIEGESQIFQITTTGTGLSYAWTYDELAAPEIGLTKTVKTLVGDEGVHTVGVTVSNSAGSTSFSWILTVESYLNSSITGGATVEVIGGFEIKTCGNGQIDDGENCFNCDEDVVCEDDEICMSGECTPQENRFPLVRIIVLITIFLVIGASAVIWIVQSRRKALAELGLRRNVAPARRNYDKSYKIISDKDEGENLYGNRPDIK